MRKFWIQNRFCVILGCQDIYQTKCDSETDKLISMFVCSDPDNTVGTPSSQTDPLNATDSPKGTLICYKLSKMDENSSIYVHFYHISKFLKDKNQAPPNWLTGKGVYPYLC